MSEHWPVILIEGVVFGGGALLFGWWQLRSLRKERERDAAERARQEAAVAAPSPAPDGEAPRT
jgi:hypothetical protein